jgi:hypothetical protein
MHLAKRWFPVLLLAALLLGGCSRGDRVRSIEIDPGGQANPASTVTDSSDQIDSDLEELYQMLGDLEDELRNTDTRIEIP